MIKLIGLLIWNGTLEYPKAIEIFYLELIL